MRVAALDPFSKGVYFVLVEGDAASFAVPFHEEWGMAEADDARLQDLAEIRKRVVEHLVRMKPDAVCVTPFEPFALTKGKPSMAAFRTAELRGVLAEAACASGCPTEFRANRDVNAGIGQRKAGQYSKDDAFWAHLGKRFLKKFRDTAIVALSKVREK